MDYPIHINTITRMELFNLLFFFNVFSGQNIFKIVYFFPLNIVFLLANSADPDEMPP